MQDEYEEHGYPEDAFDNPDLAEDEIERILSCAQDLRLLVKRLGGTEASKENLKHFSDLMEEQFTDLVWPVIRKQLKICGSIVLENAALNMFGEKPKTPANKFHEALAIPTESLRKLQEV